jgi:hypothetical protein
MRRLFILGLSLSVVLAIDVAAKPAKRKAKAPANDGFAKAVFAGELFLSGNLYLYSLQEKPGPWPKTVSYFVVDQVSPVAPAVRKAELDQVVAATKLSVLEEGKSTAIVGANTVADFARYRSGHTPALTAVVIAVNGFEIETVTVSANDVPRPTTAPEKKATAKWYADWKKEYRQLNGEDYSEDKDEMFGRPESLADAKQMATVTFNGSPQSVRVSRWNSRSVAHVGVAWFVVDILVGGKVVKTVKTGIPTGPLD